MLITFEGIDGSGKTSAVNALRDDFPAIVFTKEPTDSWYGDAVRRSITDDDADPLAELFLYTADHAVHLSETVLPALNSDRIVISDRFNDSRYAYQGVALSDRFDDALSFVQTIHRPWTRTPETTIYFDVDPAVAAERSGSANKFEQAEFLAHVQDAYERLIRSDPDRFVRIDAMKPQRDVVGAVRTVLSEVLPEGA